MPKEPTLDQHPFEDLKRLQTCRNFENFEKLDLEKKKRVIDAALEEFSTKDYTQASTNAIATKAGVSKGALFHWFNDKAGLFLYLLSYAQATIVGEVLSITSIDEGDVFDILRQITGNKLVVALRYPKETAFYVRALTTMLPEEIRSSMNRSLNQATDMLAYITNRLDEGLLREGLEKTQVVNTINWALEGMTNRIISGIDPQNVDANYQGMTAEVGDYLDFLRYLFYQKSGSTAQVTSKGRSQQTEQQEPPRGRKEEK
ncbi:MAG: TetR/AcrR family transcriptional regulator [Coriobacteriaceae bacterium]|nr:TetR/AcrR family transcriptional regulator [Coriobacteriaceae bacterium]